MSVIVRFGRQVLSTAVLTEVRLRMAASTWFSLRVETSQMIYTDVAAGPKIEP